MSVSKGGRPAACAQPGKPRCLDFVECSGCKRWKADRDRADRRRAREAAPAPAPANDAAPVEPARLRLVEPIPYDVPVIDSSLVHETRASVKLPASAVWMDSPFDWAGFGPEVTEEPSPEEAAEAEQAATRAERMANPSAMAQAAAGGVVWIVKACGAEMERLGRSWPQWDNEQVQGAVLALVHANALQSAALLLPETDPPWWSCHAVTGGALLASVGSVYYARKAEALDAPRAGVIDLERRDDSDDLEADIFEAPQAPQEDVDDSGFDFGAIGL